MCKNVLIPAVLVLYIDGSSAAGSLSAVKFDVLRILHSILRTN